VFATVLAASMVLFTLAGCNKKETAVKDETIKIGAAITSEGAFATFGVAFGTFYRAFIDYINESPDYADIMKGRKLVATIYDDKGDGAAGKTYIEKLINDDKVFALVGILGIWNLEAAKEVLVSSGVPAVYFGTGGSAQMFEPAVGKERYMMGVQPLYKTEGRIMYLRAATAFGDVKKIGVVNSTGDDGISLRAGIEAQYALDTRPNKPLVVYQSMSSTNASEIASQIQAVQDCDVILAAGNQSSFKAVYSACFSNPIAKSKPIITSYVNAALTNIPVEAVQPGAADIYTAGWITMGEPQDTPESVRRYNEMMEYWKIIDWDQNHINAAEKNAYKFNGYAMCAYVALKTFLVGIDRVNQSSKPLTAENYLEAMESARVPLALAGGVDYMGGNRINVDSLSLIKYVPPKEAGLTADKGTLTQVFPLTSIDELLATLAQ
jgi:ABC-type branched-subunit amino acid transport system substrate-binding protein